MLHKPTSVIDCDIHPAVPGNDALIPYMDEYWQEQFISRAIGEMDLASYPPSVPLSCRPDWRQAGESQASAWTAVGSRRWINSTARSQSVIRSMAAKSRQAG
ncbi:MAG: hypothetical protein EOS28_32610 [Mesorhizobium sp.]|nr:MAG: hypothetical protein EOS28_32610 [Mesorhizobium sp.]